MMKRVIRWVKSLFLKEKGVTINKLGWKRDLPDPRDHKFKLSSPLLSQELPEIVNLRHLCPPIYDQGQIGSCTANALGASFQIEQIKQKLSDFIPSRLFIYYNTRALENNIRTDSGATLRSTMKSMVHDGVCPEKMWGYNRMFTKKPKDECYLVAKDNQVLEYLRVTHNINEIKLCLFQGHTVAFGMMLYESFMSENVTRTGIIPMPDVTRESSIGGHAVLAVGYDDKKQHLIVRNSWGRNWGDKGYFYLPYTYITTPNMSADFWTIKLVEGPEHPVDLLKQVPKKKIRKRKKVD